MAELIEPFERELRRVRRREDFEPQRSDGFSNDGLSYSVANDLGKMWGQALSDYETRSKDPRFIPGAAVESPDAPEALRRELLDPIMERFAPRSMTKTASPLIREVGNDVYQIDPRTGRSVKIVDTPDRPDTRGDNFERQVILGKLSDLRRLKGDRFAMLKSGRTPEEIDAEIAALENQGREIYQPKAGIVPPVPEAPRLSPPSADVQEVTRKMKDGRRAIFDAKTKSFIRYAD